MFNLLQDLDHHTSGWVDWNMVLNTRGEPSWADTQCNSPVVTNASALEYYKQPMFYAMGHFSKFLTPNSVKIRLNKPVNETGFEAVAFERTDNATVLIALNKNNYSIPINIIDQSSGQLHYELPPKSIQSYIWWQ